MSAEGQTIFILTIVNVSEPGGQEVETGDILAFIQRSPTLHNESGNTIFLQLSTVIGHGDGHAHTASLGPVVPQFVDIVKL